MSALTGIDFDASSNGASSYGASSSGALSNGASSYSASNNRASSSGAVAAFSLPGQLGLREAGKPAAGGAAGGFESFQARLHTMLAALAAGTDEARAAGVADDAEPEAGASNALPAKGTSAGMALRGQQGFAGTQGWNVSDAASQTWAQTRPDATNPNPTSIDEAGLDATKPGATNLDATSAANLDESSDSKADSSHTARAASHEGGWNAERRKAADASGSLSTAGLVSANALPAVLAVVSPVPPRVAPQTGSSSESAAASGAQSSVSANPAPHSGAGQEGAKLATGGHTKSQSGPVEGVSGNSASGNGAPVDGATLDAVPADAPRPGETTTSADGPGASAAQEPGLSSPGSGPTHPAATADATASIATADATRAQNNSADSTLPSSQLPAGEFAQTAALSPTRTPSRSAAQPAAVRSHTSGISAISAERSAAPEPSGAAEASLLARHSAGGSGEMHAGNGASNPGSSSATGSRETFAALDAEPAAGSPGWIHANARQAEAGFQDPALGWVGVRADLSGGGVHAAILPGSAEAAQSLSGHLAGLNAHLAAEQIPVDSLRMAHTPGSESSVANQNANQGAMQGGQQGMGQQGAQQQGGHSSQQGAVSPGSMDLGQSGPQSGSAGHGDLRTSGSVSPGLFASGTHISVVA